MFSVVICSLGFYDTKEYRTRFYFSIGSSTTDDEKNLDQCHKLDTTLKPKSDNYFVTEWSGQTGTP